MAEAMREAWVNWNPDPLVHAFGEVRDFARRRLVTALCRVTVREQLGTQMFDPDDPRSCPDCAEFVREGLTLDEAHRRVTERINARMADPNVIVCRRD